MQACFVSTGGGVLRDLLLKLVHVDSGIFETENFRKNSGEGKIQHHHRIFSIANVQLQWRLLVYGRQ